MALDWTTRLAAHLSLDAAAATTFGKLLARIGEGVQSAIERRIGRTFEPVDYVEGYNGKGRETIFLRHDPVISVTSVEVMGTALTVGDESAPVYPPPQVVLENGFILRRTDGLTFPDLHGSVIVTYRAGFEEVPPDLVAAVVTWAALIFKNRDRAGISSQSMGSQTVTFTDEPPKFAERVIAQWARTAGHS